jgi:hypothetical protein
MGKPKKAYRTLPRHVLTAEDRRKGGRKAGAINTEERKRRLAKQMSKRRRQLAKAHARAGSRHWFQVSLRLSPVQTKMTARLVERENRQRLALGLKADCTMGGLAYRWFEQGLARAVAGLGRHTS